MLLFVENRSPAPGCTVVPAQPTNSTLTLNAENSIRSQEVITIACLR